ncbi:signal peptide peptidase SppA [Ralstonia insidiosa]|uniref:Signal peptide peptidase SppA n=1 Tax=Ralstonia insidiosa TaxID=190721 RepID=A0A848NXN7_9RALS|nr:signal peptide peptidase SppA [Ralstonia insidiosa]NMV37236.1 signal peptide peptidase SppA [Ralstonia insidiosa]
MRLIDIVSAPWALTPDMYHEVQSIYGRHCRGEKIDLKAVEAQIGKPLGGASSGYDMVGSVAVLPVDGVLAKRMNLFMQISGGTSMQILGQDIQAALDDPDVSAIILCIDSPGGTVDGTQELSNLIYNARGKKPILALADGTMASAAYWIGSAADKAFVSSDTTTVGSIGVVTAHMDVSGSESQRGVKTTEIAAGKYKRIASQYAPLTPEGRQTIQDQVDYTYSIFVNDVARNRGTSSEAVVEGMADGRIFIGQQAVSAGLVDGVATLDELIERLAAGEFSRAGDSVGPGALEAVPTQAADGGGAPQTAEAQSTSKGESDMDVQKLKAEHPAVAEALIAEGRQTGAEAERQRIKDVEAQSMAGHEALIASLKFDGITSGPEAAVKVLQAEKAKKEDRLAGLRADATASTVPNATAPAPGEEGDDEEDEEADDDSASASPSGGKAGKKAGIQSLPQAAVVAKRAQAYQAEQAKNGVRVSTTEAVNHITQQLKKEARHG